mgnify:CR=1 FL=1
MRVPRRRTQDFPIEAPEMAQKVFARGDKPAGSKCAFPELYGVTARSSSSSKPGKGKKNKRKRTRPAGSVEVDMHLFKRNVKV